MKNISFFLVLCFSLLFVSTARAAGGNIIMIALNTGVAKEKPVEVVVTVYEPSKTQLTSSELTKYAYNPSGYTPIGVPDLFMKIEFDAPLANQQCITKEGGKTKEYGQVYATCSSHDVGQFVVKATFLSDNPLYDGGPTAKGITAAVAVNFTKPVAKQTQTPSTPASTPVLKTIPTQIAMQNIASAEQEEKVQQQLIDAQKQNEALKKELELLQGQAQQQEKKQSIGQRMITGVQQFFAAIGRAVQSLVDAIFGKKKQ